MGRRYRRHAVVGSLWNRSKTGGSGRCGKIDEQQEIKSIDTQHDRKIEPGCAHGAYQPRYAVVTPVRDEEIYIEKTIRSMVAQNHRPIAWVIVNDGSKD